MLHAIRFISGELDTKLIMRRVDKKNIACKVVGMADAAFASDRIDRKSQQAAQTWVFGNPVWWLSRRQSMIATSSFMAETIATYELGTELVYERQMLADLGSPEKGPSLLWQDATASIATAYNDACLLYTSPSPRDA